MKGETGNLRQEARDIKLKENKNEKRVEMGGG